MNRATEYRKLSVDVRIRATGESDPRIKREWENLAQTYANMADQCDGGEEPTFDPVANILDRAAR
jgi:hypothetical protein